MKALTVKQPWANAIFALGKDVENRTWKTDYRGPLAIHAAKSPDGPSEYRRLMSDRSIHFLPAFWPNELGAVVGYVLLVDVVRNHDSHWAMPGHWHWVLREPQYLPQPIPAKGRLGLWDWANDDTCDQCGELGEWIGLDGADHFVHRLSTGTVECPRPLSSSPTGTSNA